MENNFYLLYSFNASEIIGLSFFGISQFVVGVILVINGVKFSNSFKKVLGSLALIIGFISITVTSISEIPKYLSAKNKIDNGEIFRVSGNIEDCSEASTRKITCINVDKTTFYDSNQLFGNELFTDKVLTQQVLSFENVVQIDYVKIDGLNFIIKMKSMLSKYPR